MYYTYTERSLYSLKILVDIFYFSVFTLSPTKSLTLSYCHPHYKAGFHHLLFSGIHTKFGDINYEPFVGKRKRLFHFFFIASGGKVAFYHRFDSRIIQDINIDTEKDQLSMNINP